jgi:hypothetical protein
VDIIDRYKGTRVPNHDVRQSPIPIPIPIPIHPEALSQTSEFEDIMSMEEASIFLSEHICAAHRQTKLRLGRC